MGKWPKTVIYLALLVVLILIPFFVTIPYYLGLIIAILINVLLAASVWLIMLTGQVSVGHVGFAAIGGYISAALVKVYGFSFWPSLLLAMIVAGAVALILGLITLRIKGQYFIITGICFLSIVQIGFGMWEYPFGGLVGILNLPAPNPIAITGLPVINFTLRPPFYYLVLVLVLIALVLMHRMDRSRIGLVFRGISQADSLTEHIGINIMWYKVMAFIIGSMFAALAGVLYAFFAGCMLPTCFGFWQSIYCLTYVAVGGAANIGGPILGATILSIVSVLLRPIKTLEPVVYGAVLIATMIFFRTGLLGGVQALSRKIKKVMKSANA